MTEMRQAVVDAVIAAGIVNFAFESPRTFKSGIVSPVYLDNRRLLMHPASWRTVIGALKAEVERLRLAEPVIAGIETAGIPHSSALAYEMGLPSVFVRKQTKAHGLQQRIEGGDIRGREAILIEDQITTGASSLSSVFPLREAGATVNHCFAITSYGFVEAKRAFAAADVVLHVLVTFDALFEAVKASGGLIGDQVAEIERWMSDPRGWSPQRSS